MNSLLFPLFATGISLGPVFLLGLSAFAMEAAYASRAAVIPVISCRMASKVMASVSDKRIRTLRGDGIIHEVGDNDANNGDDDEKGINDIPKDLPRSLVTSLDFLNDSFEIGTSEFDSEMNSDNVFEEKMRTEFDS
ncbi:hypothetical protein Tco_1578316 [Tanacetum coccineum]